MENLTLDKRQSQYRTTTLVMLIVFAGTLLARLLSSVLSDFLSDTMSDVVFSVIVQLGFCLALPFLIYKFVLKKSTKEVLRFSNFRKCDWKIMLLCIPLGFFALMVTMGVSTVWANVLYVFFGYWPSSSPSVMPETFNVGYMILSLLLSAVLPAVCEEFVHRGGFLTVMRGSFSEGKTIVFCGFMFGIFHQYVPQVFYTFLFGMLACFLTIKTKSIFPAMIVHFMNNGTSVYLEYAETYGFWGGGFTDWINDVASQNFLALFGLFFASIIAIVGIVYLIVWLSKRERKKQIDETVEMIKTQEEIELDPDKGVIGAPLSDTIMYKSTTRDKMFLIGAIVLGVATTIFSLIWGLFQMLLP